MRRDRTSREAQAPKASPLDPVKWAQENPVRTRGGQFCRLCMIPEIAAEIAPTIIAIRHHRIDSTVERLRHWLAEERGVTVSSATMWRHARECVREGGK